MKTMLCLLTASVLFACSPISVYAADEETVLDDLKCFIMPRKGVKGKKVMEYKGAKLYLCCGTCVRRMEKTPEKYEAKANHQLVKTGQFVQKACAITGGAIATDSPTLEIVGIKVRFASDKEKQAVSKLEVEEQIAKVFGAESFKRGKFQLKQADKK